MKLRTITFDDLLAMRPCWDRPGLSLAWGSRMTATVWDVATAIAVRPMDRIWVILRMMTSGERKALTGYRSSNRAHEELLDRANAQWHLEGRSPGTLGDYDEEQICRLLLSLGEVPE